VLSAVKCENVKRFHFHHFHMRKELISKPKDSKSWRDSYYHKLFGLKAAKAVERILPIFEKECPGDDRPHKALDAIRAWALGERKLGMAEVRNLSLGAHAAAREAKTDAAKYVAHAAGQAVGTWHAPAHALGAFWYAGRVYTVNKNRKQIRRIK